MCGITAIFSYRSTADGVSSNELAAITESMRARGPDAGGTWISPDARVGLGSRRLAIIDLSDEGTQPMFDVERELVIAYNGEIYNYRELRASLERSNARFHSHTDTEVLLQLYRRDGERMLGLLRGMFAFVIWDTRMRRLFVARDPYGIKPLYFADDGGTIRFASEVKSLLAGGTVSRTIDPAGAAGFFLTGSVPEPFTIRKEVRAVEAGTSFFVDEEHGHGDVLHHVSVAGVLRRACTLRPIAHLTEPDIAVRERIEETVAHHLVSDVPVGVFLSSGIDSSALTTIASRIATEPLRTFTLAFEEFRGSSGDEAPLAERFARDSGTIHTTRMVPRDEFRRIPAAARLVHSARSIRDSRTRRSRIRTRSIEDSRRVRERDHTRSRNSVRTHRRTRGLAVHAQSITARHRLGEHGPLRRSAHAARRRRAAPPDRAAPHRSRQLLQRRSRGRAPALAARAPQDRLLRADAAVDGFAARRHVDAHAKLGALRVRRTALTHGCAGWRLRGRRRRGRRLR